MISSTRLLVSFIEVSDRFHFLAQSICLVDGSRDSTLVGMRVKRQFMRRSKSEETQFDGEFSR